MKVIINESSNQDWVLKELQVAYQAETREVETWKKGHKDLPTSYNFAKFTFQSEINAMKKKVEDCKKTCQELTNAHINKEDKYKEDLATLEQARAMTVEGMQHAQMKLQQLLSKPLPSYRLSQSQEDASLKAELEA